MSEVKAFANMQGYSDVHPYEVVRVVSNKTVEIRPMIAELVKGWKPEIEIGGFVGHCSNQETQEYTYESDPDAHVIRIRLRNRFRNVGWFSKYDQRFVMADQPHKYYDYNF